MDTLFYEGTNIQAFVFWFFFLAQLSNMTIPTSQSSMLHLQSNIQHSPLGLSIINTHSGSVSSHTTAGNTVI